MPCSLIFLVGEHDRDSQLGINSKRERMTRVFSMVSDKEIEREDDEVTFFRLVSIGGVLVVSDNEAGSIHPTRGPG